MEREPYQQASDESVRQSYLPNKILKGASQLGSAIATGGAVLPFLSKYIPENIMIKGLSKFNPKIGKFITSSLQAGESLDQIKDFIRDKVEPKEEKENAQQTGNVIEQYSPELNQFIMSEIEKGRQPLEAGALASLNPKFKKIIDKLTQDHKSPFSALLQTVYGGDEQMQGQQPQQQMQQPQGQRQQQQAPQQGGQGQQALMAILQKIQQQRGG